MKETATNFVKNNFSILAVALIVGLLFQDLSMGGWSLLGAIVGGAVRI